MSSKSPASLVNPLAEYRNLISKQGVRELSEEADRVLESQTKGSLMQWLSPNVESDFIVAMNKLLSDSVELTLSGELKYSGIQYDSGNGKRHWSEYFAVAARNYQKILEIAQNHLPMIQQYQLTFMACAELHNANQQASAAVLARKARDLLERTSSQERIDDVINKGIHEAMLAFFEGRFASIPEIIAPYLVQAKQVLEEIEISREQVFDFSCALYLHESLRAFSYFMVAGKSSNLDLAEVMLSKAKALATQTGRPDLLYFVNKLQISMNSLTSLSVWTLRKYFKTTHVSEETVKTYVEKALIQHSRFYLYPSQLQALEEGILDSSRKNVLIAMPTGSGKTLISELIMINTLMGLQQNSLAIFMAPSRALVHEKFDELSRSLAALNLKVCQITGEVTMDSEAQIADYDVAVVTPEKFDMLMRKRFYGAKTGLLIVDEFHNIRLGFRGIRIQFGLMRFIEQNPLARIVLMSAVIPNASQVREWVNATASIVSFWQPTYARVGILKPEETLGRIEFSDGTIRRVPFTRKFKGLRQRAAYVAIYFASEGPCMLFSSNQDGVFSYSKYLVELLQSSGTSLVSAETTNNGRPLSERLRRLIGEKEDIYQLFERGIGVHWGDLPHEIRRIVEAGLRENVIKLVVATTTLAEGVNLPLKTVVVPTAAVAGLPMDMSVFFNLMGRAGRPNREVEGQLVLMNPTRKDQPPVEKYFEATHASLDPIQTAILRIVEAENSVRKSENKSLSGRERRRIERLIGDLELYRAVLHSVLVAALEEKLIVKIPDPILAEKIVIGSRNLVPQETYTSVLTVLQEADRSLKELGVVDEQGLTRYGREVVYPSGFSPETCRLLESRLKDGLGGFSQITRFDKDKELIAGLLQLMTVPIEARMFFSKNLPSSFEWMVLDWMDGWTLTSLASKYFEGRVSETMTQIQGKLSAFASWFLYAVYLNVNYLDPKSSLAKTIEDFPRYSWFGTRDPIALRILSKDLSRELLRDDVLRVVERLGHSVAEGLVKNPGQIESTDFKNRILAAVHQSDGEEFVGSLQKILARK